jgi:hypothetical protein
MFRFEPAWYSNQSPKFGFLVSRNSLNPLLNLILHLIELSAKNIMLNIAKQIHLHTHNRMRNELGPRPLQAPLAIA